MNTIHVYRDADGKWRWRIVSAGNHRIRAASGESFSTKSNAVRAIRTLLNHIVFDDAFGNARWKIDK